MPRLLLGLTNNSQPLPALTLISMQLSLVSVIKLTLTELISVSVTLKVRCEILHASGLSQHSLTQNLCFCTNSSIFSNLFKCYVMTINTRSGNDLSWHLRPENFPTSHWHSYYMVKAVHCWGHPDGTLPSIISRYVMEIFVYVNPVMTKLCHWS